MNRTRILKSSLLMIVVLVVLIGAVVAVPGTAMNSSAVQINLTRQPRPHPQSHLKIGEPDNVTRLPRPHPKSHMRLTATAMPLYQP